MNSSKGDAQRDSDLRIDATEDIFGFGKMPVRKLSAADRKIFLDMLENPPEPNEAMLNAAEEYKRRVISR